MQVVLLIDTFQNHGLKCKTIKTPPAAILIGACLCLYTNYGFGNRLCKLTVANKAQISFLTDRFINALTSFLQKVEKFAFNGAFSDVCQTYMQHALIDSAGSKQAGSALRIAK